MARISEQIEESADAPATAHAYLAVGDPIPAVVDDEWLMTRVLHLKKSAYFRHKAAGRYRFLEVSQQISGLTLYSGAKVQRWLNGDGRESRQYFAPRPKSTRGRRKSMSLVHAATVGPSSK